MKRLITIVAILAAVLMTTLTADADVYVHGYTRSNGTYVQPHYRSDPDGNFNNNWSTYPNVNPHTGAVGTRHTPSYSDSYYEPEYTLQHHNAIDDAEPMSDYQYEPDENYDGETSFGESE